MLYNPKNQEDTFYGIDDFTGVRKFDAHMHLNTRNQEMYDYAISYNMGLLSINVDVPDFPSLEEQQECSLAHLKNNDGKFGYVASFRIRGIENADWLENTISHLEKSVNNGAVGIKVWKNIGMEYKDGEGNFVMIDDPRLDPVFDFLEKKNVTLVGHLGEPKNCWLPVEEMTVANDKDYFKNHPEYHMYLHPEYPSYEQQIEARDRMLEKHKDMRFVGAHLASLEWSIDEIAVRLDTFPNMAVDLAERISHLQYQTVRDYEKVRDFFIRYQDRILYGTDIIINDAQPIEKLKQHVQRIWLGHWKYFTSNEIMQAPEVLEEFRSLHLPKEVVDKLYYDNIKRWYPGV